MPRRPSAVTADQRPADCLAADVQIETERDVDRALLELAFIQAHEQDVEARARAAAEQVRTEAAGELVVDFGDEQVSYADRREQLNAELERFCKAHKQALLPKGSKTRKLTHGSVAWKKQRDAVEYRKGKGQADALAALAKTVGAEGLVDWLTQKLRRFKLGTGKDAATVADVVNVKVTINRSTVLSLVDKNRLAAKALAALCMKLVRGKDQFEAKPATFNVESTSEQQPARAA